MNDIKDRRDRSNEAAKPNLERVAVDVRRLTTNLERSARAAGLVYQGGVVLIDSKFRTAPSMAWRVWSNEGETIDEKYYASLPKQGS